MDEIKKIAYYNELFDCYQKTLTAKQTEYFIMYFQKDYSLKEIADYYKITRNAVHDLLNVTIKKLLDYEEKLKLLENSKKRKEYYNLYLQTNDKKWLEKIIETDDIYGV